MKIEKNKMVSLIYELRESGDDGRIIEELNEEGPLNFIYGTGRLLPDFESNIHSLSAGDSFRFGLKSSDAYGDRREEMVIDVPISVFQTEDGSLNEEICRVGNNVPMMDGDGNHLNGLVNEITDEFVKMDFNHPMAGVDLFFTGRILNVREATPEEIAATTHSCSSCGSHSSDGCGGSCQ
ncbi:MAG TPA: FKBP-type peptidyl-prolyl cis-trans isomerase [Bacteroidales bacterium]|nr:FKBP-type peptidyl-prolyl cis-trans isomerase [Bacteroidales bacterium]